MTRPSSFILHIVILIIYKSTKFGDALSVGLEDMVGTCIFRHGTGEKIKVKLNSCIHFMVRGITGIKSKRTKKLEKKVDLNLDFRWLKSAFKVLQKCFVLFVINNKFRQHTFLIQLSLPAKGSI